MVQTLGKGRCAHTRTVGKVSSHNEYLENWSRDVDVTLQPLRGDLTARPWTLSRIFPVRTNRSVVGRR